MTAAEYNKAYTAARKRWPSLIRSSMAEIKAAYSDASAIVTEAFSDATGTAIERLSAIEAQLRQANATIAEKLLSEVPKSVTEGQALYSAIDQSLLSDLFAGSTKVALTGLKNVSVVIDNRLISNTINRMYQDGYALSARCWNIGTDYQTQITRLINSGYAQGLSTAKITRSIGDYTKGGISALSPSYTSAKYGQVIVKNVDWRALRLVRTEFSASMKIGAVMQGEENPACIGLYDWVRVNTQQHECICPGLASGSPYNAENIPVQPHSNCMCQVRARLRDLKEVSADIKRWNSGESVPYLDQWYARAYLPVQ